MREFDCFPFEEEKFEYLDKGKVTVRKITSYDVIGYGKIIYLPYKTKPKPIRISNENT